VISQIIKLKKINKLKICSGIEGLECMLQTGKVKSKSGVYYRRRLELRLSV